MRTTKEMGMKQINEIIKKRRLIKAKTQTETWNALKNWKDIPEHLKKIINLNNKVK